MGLEDVRSAVAFLVHGPALSLGRPDDNQNVEGWRLRREIRCLVQNCVVVRFLD